MEVGPWSTLPIRKAAVKTIFSIFSGGDQEGDRPLDRRLGVGLDDSLWRRPFGSARIP